MSPQPAEGNTSQGLLGRDGVPGPGGKTPGAQAHWWSEIFTVVNASLLLRKLRLQGCEAVAVGGRCEHSPVAAAAHAVARSQDTLSASYPHRTTPSNASSPPSRAWFLPRNTKKFISTTSYQVCMPLASPFLICLK